MNFFRYSVWPVVKVRLRYWWWIVKYGGKKNIPREVLFGALEASAKRMADNLQKAFRAMPSDTDSEKVRKLIEAIQKGGELRRGIAEMSRDAKHD